MVVCVTVYTGILCLSHTFSFGVLGFLLLDFILGKGRPVLMGVEASGKGSRASFTTLVTYKLGVHRVWFS